MTVLNLQLPEDEAQALFRLIHQTPGAQESLFQAYRQLQSYFFNQLTVDELRRLLGEPS